MSASLGRWKHAEVPGGEAVVSELVVGHKAVVALPLANSYCTAAKCAMSNKYWSSRQDAGVGT